MDVINVVLIEENLSDAAFLENHLSSIRNISIHLHHSSGLEDASVFLRNNSASIILLSVDHLSEKELDKIKLVHKMAPTLPIVTVLNASSKDFILPSVSAGAEDYLLKESLIPELTARTLRYAIQHKKNSEKLRESERKYKDLVTLLPQTVFEMDLNGTLTFVNDSGLNTFGYCLEDLKNNLTAFQMIDEKDRDRASSNIQRALRGEKNSDSEYTARRKDGSSFPVLIFSNAVVRNGITRGLSGIIVDITERKKNDEALLKSESKYRSIFNLAPVGIFQSTFEGKFISVNERLVQILGYESREELMTCNIAKDIYYNEKDRLNVLSDLSAKANSADLQICWKKKDGTPIWIQLTFQATFDESGGLQYYDGFVRNITERVEAETRLRENQKLLSTVIETMPLGIWMIDKDGTIIHGNSAAQNIWGGAKYVGIENYGEYKGWFVNTGEPIKPDEWGAARVLKNGVKIVNEELEIEDFNGKRKFILHSAVPTRNSRKEITGAIVVNQDITEIRQKDSQIRKLSRAVEQSPVLIVITDPTGKIEYVNPKFEQVTGYSREETLGKNPRFLKSGHTSKETYEDLWKTITAGNEWRGEFHNICKDGSTYWESAVISPVKNNAGVITNFLAVKEDISDQKKTTTELIAAKERAEHSDHLKTEFLAQMSHEVRTPLNILLSFSTYIRELLEERDQLTEDLEQYFTTTTNAGNRIIRTIELILNMSDLKSGSFVNDPKPTDIVNDILKHIYHQFHQSVDERKIKFDLIQKSESLFSNVDEFATEQLLIHLIDNAIKFTEKGHVRIYAEQNHHGSSVIRIEDTGVGISKDYLKKMFTEFSQEDQGYSRAYDGNGLGLALVKKYCELNNIHIDIKSEKGMGTIVTLTFPK